MSAKKKTNGYYHCKRCGLQFDTQRQLGGHLSKGPICPELLHSSAALTSSTGSALASSSASQTNNNNNNNNNSETEDTADEDEQDQQQQQQQQPPRRVRRVVPETIYQLLQRPTHLEHNHRVRRAIIAQPAQPALPWPGNVHKFHETQDCYDEYCVSLRDLYSDEFWSVFGSVYKDRAGVIDRVLSTTKRVFVYKEAKRRYVKEGEIIHIDPYMHPCMHPYMHPYMQVPGIGS